MRLLVTLCLYSTILGEVCKINFDGFITDGHQPLSVRLVAFKNKVSRKCIVITGKKNVRFEV